MISLRDACLTLLVAAFCWDSAAAVQTPTPYRVLIGNGDTLSHAGHLWTVTSVGAVETDPGGGWTALLSADAATLTAGSQVLLVGALPGGSIDDVTVIEGPGVSQGQITSRVIQGSMVDGQIGTIIRFGGEVIATLGGTTVMQTGFLLPGTSDGIVGISAIQPTGTPGRAFVNCFLEGPLLDVREAIVEIPSMEILLSEGDLVPNLDLPIEAIELSVQCTRSGDHWWSNVRFAGDETFSPRRGVVVDGEIFDLGGGSRLLERDPLPTYAASSGTWQPLLRFLMNEEGDWTARGATTAIGTLILRNGRVAFEPDPTFTTIVSHIDVDGMAIGANIFDVVAESNRFLDRPALIDIDGDGLSDPAYVWPPQTSTTFGGPSDGRISLFRTIIDTPGIGSTVILSVPDYRVDEFHCPGVPNSTGQSGGLAAAGRSAVDDNRLELLTWDLPEASFGFFIISKTPGFSSQPGGSMGDLCLSGAVGRFADQIFSVGRTGRAAASVDLTSIPQPVAAVAVQPGETWYAQAWHRDAIAGVATSNFTSAISITFD